MPDDTYLAVLADLTALYPALPDLRFKRSHRQVTHIAHGWYMRTHRSVDAVMLLRNSGYATESWPIRRSIIEHTVALKWLAADGSHVANVVRRAHAFGVHKRREAVVAAGWTSVDLATFDDVIADIDATDEHRALDHLHHFKARCDKYGTPHDLSGYLIDTAHSHPTWDTACPYFDRDENGVITLNGVPMFNDADRDDAGFCAIYLWQALTAMHAMLETGPWQATLDSTWARIQRLAPR